MIYDNLKFCAQYASAHPRFQTAFDFLRAYKGAPVGRVELGEGVFALVQQYNTKAPEACRWETHDKYIDLQYVVKGRETFGVAKREDLSESIPYNPEKDVTFYTGQGSEIELSDGDFAIVFPWDAHKPQIGDGASVDKIVIKILF